MPEKSQIFKLLRRLGVWSVPLICIISFVPLISALLVLSESPSAKQPEKSSILPSLGQIPSFSQQQDQPQVSKKSAVSAATPFQSPKPQPSSAKEKRNPTASTQKKSSAVNHRRYNPLLPQLPQYKSPPIEIKVAVVKDAESAAVATSTPASILDTNNKVLRTLPANQGFLATANGLSLNLGTWQLPSVVWLQPSKGGLIYIGDRWYRGKILLLSQGSTLLAVNYVDLEHYLYSVVGSEMHANAPMEALKAQAIAARSYALVHIIRPASQWYHLGATPRWQAYKGIESEYNTTQQAVSATAGQILSLRGGVVESLYAATDDIVVNVHGGRGMSQTGAYKLASSGYDYQQILGRYYPGVSLARLVLQQ